MIFGKNREKKRAMEDALKEELKLTLTCIEERCQQSDNIMIHKLCHLSPSGYCRERCAHFEKARGWAEIANKWIVSDFKPTRCRLWPR
jgi:hypothetical protein